MQSKIVIRKENKMYSTRNSEVALKKIKKKIQEVKAKKKSFDQKAVSQLKAKKTIEVAEHKDYCYQDCNGIINK